MMMMRMMTLISVSLCNDDHFAPVISDRWAIVMAAVLPRCDPHGVSMLSAGEPIS